MTLHSPRILFVTPSWPLGDSFGGQMRALNVARALKKVGGVSLLVVGSNADNKAARESSAAEFACEPPMHEHAALNRGASSKLRWALDPGYLNLHGVVTSVADRERMSRYLHEYDLVWVMNGRTPNILQLWRWPHTHLDVDDVPSTCYRTATTPGLLQAVKRRAHWAILRQRERAYGRRFTTLSVCSEADRRYLGSSRVHVIPNGFARPAVEPVRNVRAERPLLGFIGLYSHGPNLDGMRWFLRDVWPLVRAAVPGVRLRMVGKGTDGADRPTDPDVDPLGWVSDPAAEIATWSAMINPIRYGGGTRIKIADAFSRKCPVVSTHYGAFGYEVRDGHHLRLADRPARFADACIQLLRDPVAGAALAGNAWQAFLQNWTWEAITPRVWAAAEDCLRRSVRERSRS